MSRELLSGLPHKEFRCILADPAWNYRTYSDKGKERSAEQHYATMSIDDIKALPVAQHAAKDAHLFLWTTGPHLPLAFEVMTAWGFKYSGTGFVWVKLQKSFVRDQLVRTHEIERALHFGLGHTTRKNAEFCLLGRRGKPQRLAANVREIIISPLREHSRKPEEAHERIEHYCAGPRLELFGRQQRPGWIVRGNESHKFGADA